MNIREARETMYELLTLFFKAATVVYGSQSHAVKEKPPVVVLTTISVSRPMNPPTEIIDGNPVSYYPTNMALQVDLYTKGALVEVGERQLAPVENTALNDMIEFANFIGSEYLINWCHQKDIAPRPEVRCPRYDRPHQQRELSVSRNTGAHDVLHAEGGGLHWYSRCRQYQAQYPGGGG